MSHIEDTSFYEDMITVTGRLPVKEEYHRVRHLVLPKPIPPPISDDDLVAVIPACPHLETAILCGIPDLTDRTVVLLAETALNLQSIDLTGCEQVTDVGVLALISKSLALQSIRLSGVKGLTDPAVSAIAKRCSRLLELELCDLPLITASSIRDVWSYSRKLRTLRLADCPLIANSAFPAIVARKGEKPLPPLPTTWLDKLPSLILGHATSNLHILDLAGCKITDDAIAGVVAHAPKLQSLVLTGCTALTDRSLESILTLGENLYVLMLGHVLNVTDQALIKLVRGCPNIRCIDVAFCRQLTDMSVFELTGLRGLRRLSLIHKLTDIGMYSLANQASSLERLHLSYCDRLSLKAIHYIVKKCGRLEFLSATGVPACKRKGSKRFSDAPPPVRAPPIAKVKV